MPSWAISIVASLVLKVLGSTVLDKPTVLHLYARAKATDNKLEVGTVKLLAKSLGVDLPADEPAKPVV